jgi:hypothetical protein
MSTFLTPGMDCPLGQDGIPAPEIKPDGVAETFETQSHPARNLKLFKKDLSLSAHKTETKSIATLATRQHSARYRRQIISSKACIACNLHAARSR